MGGLKDESRMAIRVGEEVCEGLVVEEEMAEVVGDEDADADVELERNGQFEVEDQDTCKVGEVDMASLLPVPVPGAAGVLGDEEDMIAGQE